jgi:dsRNA-specific ribonuclease
MYLKIMLMIQAPVRKLLSLNFLCLLSQADNEKYEHLGDTVLGLVVTGLLLDMYPCLRVGPSTASHLKLRPVCT